MGLSRRMKEILVILSQTSEGMYRYNLIYAIEKDNWSKKTRHSGQATWRVPLDTVRVSYDRTLSQLISLNLVDGYYLKGVPKLSPYAGTLWGGKYYKLTEKGRALAAEVIETTLREITRFNELILNSLDDPKLHGEDLTPRCPYCRKKLEASEVMQTKAEPFGYRLITYRCTKCGKNFGLFIPE